MLYLCAFFFSFTHQAYISWWSSINSSDFSLIIKKEDEKGATHLFVFRRQYRSNPCFYQFSICSTRDILTFNIQWQSEFVCVFWLHVGCRCFYLLQLPIGGKKPVFSNLTAYQQYVEAVLLRVFTPNRHWWRVYVFSHRFIFTIDKYPVFRLSHSLCLCSRPKRHDDSFDSRATFFYVE